MSTFEKTYQVPFDTGTTYDYWVSSDTVIPPAASMNIDPREGGVYQLVMPGGFSMNGKFTEVEPGKALRYSWLWDGDDEESVVSVTFSANADGTAVHIIHGEFATQEAYDNHATGWDSYVEGFTAFVRARTG